MASLNDLRNTPPTTPAHLWSWVRAYTGVRVSRGHVCRDHTPPAEWLSRLWLDCPSESLVLGSRGSGKSFLAAILTHLESRFHPSLGTRILGGSKAQSAQIFEAITLAVLDGAGPGGSDADALDKLLKTEARYANGSAVSILAASSKSVRGPHVPRLKLDEVDEIEPDLRESSMGMCMPTRACPIPASVVMTSTWHRVGGPMSALIERGRSGQFPVWTTCTFDVLERCSEDRSGPYVGADDLFLNCPQCPLKRWCHSERDRNGNQALAKLSDGHYAIEALVQKTRTVSARAFDSDYLCKGPRVDGLWFPEFDADQVVSHDAEFDPALPVHVSIDSGVVTGAVLFQVATVGGELRVHVFADYLSEGKSAESNARTLLELCRTRCNNRRDVVSTDSAGGSRNPVGPTVIAEYERVGLKGTKRNALERWPVGSVADSLALVDALIRPADGPPRLKIHPRCLDTIKALSNYRRAKRGGAWQDYPEDPQHPYEDLVDSLRGGLKVALPDGRLPARTYNGRSTVGGIFS